jgi:hypothetical protein
MRTVTLRVPGNEKATLITRTDPSQATSIIDSQDPWEKSYVGLRRLMFFTAFTHAVTAIIMISVYINKTSGAPPTMGVGRVGRIASCWSGPPTDLLEPNAAAVRPDQFILYITNRMSTSTGVGRHDAIAGFMVAFFILSAAFQSMSCIRYEAHRSATMTNAPQWVRYTEYSITASCMMVTILISIGLLDVYLLVCVFLFTALCMFGGLLSDYLRDISVNCVGITVGKIRWAMLASHIMSWLSMMIPWAIVFTSVYDMSNSTFANVCGTTPGRSNMPGFVWGIIIGQFALFNVFGLVQIYQFRRQFYLNPYNNRFLETKEAYKAAATGITIETSFVFLSLLSKTLLGWLLFTQVLIA